MNQLINILTFSFVLSVQTFANSMEAMFYLGETTAQTEQISLVNMIRENTVIESKIWHIELKKIPFTSNLKQWFHSDKLLRIHNSEMYFDFYTPARLMNNEGEFYIPSTINRQKYDVQMKKIKTEATVEQIIQNMECDLSANTNQYSASISSNRLIIKSQQDKEMNIGHQKSQVQIKKWKEHFLINLIKAGQTVYTIKTQPLNKSKTLVVKTLENCN